MAATFPRESAWKAVAQKHRLRDNGLQKALALYEKLDEDKYVDRIKALDAAKKFAASLGKAREVAANGEASKFLDQLEASAESTKKLVATAAKAEAQVVAKRRSDFAKVRALNVGIRRLADLSKSEQGGVDAAKDGNVMQCRNEFAELGRTAMGVITAVVVCEAAIAADGPTVGLSTVAVVAAMMALVVAIEELIQNIDKLVKCLNRHNNTEAIGPYEVRLRQARELRAQVIREKERLAA